MTTSMPIGSPRASIINRLKSPFASKQNPQIKQDIQLEEPFRECSPGDSIRGQVHLDVPKPIRATHLVVRLLGFVKVITHSKLPGEQIPYDENLLNSTKGRRGGEYFGNGFAKLFEDEHVLCGDGRLFGKYLFQFEVLLPQQNTPSSIDFENGTITYLITSTLTRPTTISPTLVEHCKVKVKEVIDIARVPRPRPQSISLETVNKRRPVIHIRRRISDSVHTRDRSGEVDEIRNTASVSQSSAPEVPTSPGPSEISSTSPTDSSNSNSRSAVQAPPSQDTRSITSGVFSSATSDKTITAQTEVLQGGCLPGDTIPIRVSVDHTKVVKSMQGLIVTLYRLARIDTHPALPLGPSDGSSNAKYEDYYPKSRTGLGGLSLSSAGSSRTFRQDIAQNIAPLIIDPHTMSAIVKTSIQVPEHVFPSISGVPGSMISFKYYIEVIVDLRGRFGQDKILPKFSMTNVPQHAYEEPKINLMSGKDGMTFSSTPGFNFLVTDQIRRQKGIVHTKTEVLVGTIDSTRFQTRLRAQEPSQSNGHKSQSSQFSEGGPPIYERNQNRRSSSQHDRDRGDAIPSNFDSWHFNSYTATSEEPLDEKARIRRAEETLLPSAPPDSGPSSNGDIMPSAPAAFDEDDFQHADSLEVPAPRYQASAPTPETEPPQRQSPIRTSAGLPPDTLSSTSPAALRIEATTTAAPNEAWGAGGTEHPHGSVPNTGQGYVKATEAVRAPSREPSSGTLRQTTPTKDLEATQEAQSTPKRGDLPDGQHQVLGHEASPTNPSVPDTPNETPLVTAPIAEAEQGTSNGTTQGEGT